MNSKAECFCELRFFDKTVLIFDDHIYSASVLSKQVDKGFRHKQTNLSFIISKTTLVPTTNINDIVLTEKKFIGEDLLFHQ